MPLKKEGGKVCLRAPNGIRMQTKFSYMNIKTSPGLLFERVGMSVHDF